MAKKNNTQNLKPDTILKNYWRDSGQFADFFNAVLFGGEQVISPDELKDVDTERTEWLHSLGRATTLYGMLNIPDKMKPFINDYKILLVEARQNDFVFHNMNNVDFFNMIRIVLDKSMEKNDVKKKVIEYAAQHNVDKTITIPLPRILL